MLGAHEKEVHTEVIGMQAITLVAVPMDTNQKESENKQISCAHGMIYICFLTCSRHSGQFNWSNNLTLKDMV